MPVDLYYMRLSPPSAAVIILAKTLGVPLNLKLVNLLAGEQLKPEFLKLNPTHTVPTLVDGDFVLFESHAILSYLADKYGKDDGDDGLYPKDLQRRAIVNQRLLFDASVLYQRHADYFYPQMFHGKPEDPEKFKPLQEALGFVDTFVATTKWVAGDKPTIADYALAVTVKAITLGSVDLSSYANLTRWYAQFRADLPHWSIVEENLAEFQPFFDSLKKQ